MRTKFPASELKNASCGLCDQFYKSKAFYDTDKKKGFRSCPHAKKDGVVPISPICEESNFKLASWFHCDKLYNWCTPAMCINRQEIKAEKECKRCTNGKLVAKLLGR